MQEHLYMGIDGAGSPKDPSGLPLTSGLSALFWAQFKFRLLRCHLPRPDLTTLPSAAAGGGLLWAHAGLALGLPPPTLELGLTGRAEAERQSSQVIGGARQGKAVFLIVPKSSPPG